MTRHLHHYTPAKTVRDSLESAILKADQIHQQEKLLVVLLHEIDQRRYFTRYGFKSLTGFCLKGLQFSKTQSQRLVTAVRRYEPTDNIGKKTLS